jgi:hypothetical protein
MNIATSQLRGSVSIYANTKNCKVIAELFELK